MRTSGSQRLRAIGLLLALLLASSPAPACDYRNFSSAGVNIAYCDNGGSGVPVIFLHGLDGAYEPHYSPIGDRLGAPFRVIGLDLRGHGRSDKPHDEAAYGRQFAADVIDLMDSMAIDKAHLVGHSLGGIVAMYLAARHPQRFHSVVTIGNGLFHEGELRLVGWLLRGMFVWNRLKVIAGIAAPDPRPERDEAALVAVTKSLTELTVSEQQAAAIRLPLLAARGGPDDDPRSTVERLVKLNPATQMIRIESADHITLLADPEFQEGLRTFLLRYSPTVRERRF